MTTGLTIQQHLKNASELAAAMAAHGAAARADDAVEAIVAALAASKPVLVCGNGGSAADAMHIAGEMVGRFLVNRKAYNVIALTADNATLTAWSNDVGYDTVFSRQVEAYGAPGGVVWGISTSGNSPNVIKAFEQAKKQGMVTLALTGAGGGKMAPLADILIDVPSKRTPDIQQVHMCIYHYICEVAEARLAEKT
ncbi:MAG: SIS domain-containing protein [Alphaproteobacteria bacterium]|nr:SIS domain-containing protein [Alphaproteobacteria bacterium]